ncbi:MAG: hypothetical protein IT260_12710 [Saprospiraceae bacterium]|nr:hypothetical protein [Saprospiraceae bacterium]
MELKLEIRYEQLLQLFRQLPFKEKKQFLREIEKEIIDVSAGIDLESKLTDHPRMDMKNAAALLLEDYRHDEDLTIFTAIDADDFHDAR